MDTPSSDAAGGSEKPSVAPSVAPPNWAQQCQAWAAVLQLILAVVGVIWIDQQIDNLQHQRAAEENRRNIEIMSRLYAWDNEIILMSQRTPHYPPCFFADPEGDKVRALLQEHPKDATKVEVELLSIVEQYGNMWDYFFHLERNLRESSSKDSKQMHKGGSVTSNSPTAGVIC